MSTRIRASRLAPLAATFALLGAASVQAVPTDLSDFFNDGTINTQEWLRINVGTMVNDPTPIWRPVLGSDAAPFATAITRLEDIRRGRLSFDAPRNGGTNSWSGYVASGWTFDPRLVGNDPMGMGDPDPNMPIHVSGLGDDDTAPFADDDPELEDRPSTFDFSINARFADRGLPPSVDNGARNGLIVSVHGDTANDIGFTNPLDRQFTGNTTGAGGFEAFIENDNQPGLRIGVRPAGNFPGDAADVFMRLPRGQKFDGRIQVRYVNDNNQGGLNQVTVSFITDEGPIFMGTLDNVFGGAQEIVDNEDMTLRTYIGVTRPTLFIGAISVNPQQKFSARQAYFDNFIMSTISNAFDGDPMGSGVVTDIDGDMDTDAVDLAAALDSAIPVSDEVILQIVVAIDPTLDPRFYLKARQYNRAIGRYYKENVLPAYAGVRSQKEKRADRRRLKALRGIAPLVLR